MPLPSSKATDPRPDILRAHYDALPGFHGSVPESHPARLAAIARLLGLAAAAPDRCRVLELGCGTGLNLLPLAERLPRSEFVGVDLSPVQIAVAEELRQESGLKNARFDCADLRTWQPEPGAFDYVIAHGVYSWVPDEVKERLLAICARALTLQGVAYVSYNVLPAWGALGALRTMLLAEMEGANDPRARVAQILRVLAQAFAQQPGAAATLARAELAEMQTKSFEALRHDELAPVNDPVTFRHFAAHAARHGLHWFAEAHFASLPCEHLPVTARDALAELQPDAWRAQQFLDLLGHRRFRNSLLTRAPAPDFTRTDPAVVRSCALGLRMSPGEGRIVIPRGEALHLRGPHDFAMSVEKPEQKAFFAALCEAAPGRISFVDAGWRAAAFLAQAGESAVVNDDLMAQGLLKLFIADQLDLLLAGGGDWLASRATPEPSQLVRALARRGYPVVNRWHETVQLSAAQRRWLAGESAEVDVAALTRTGLLV